jgi:hypothetical protein
MVASAYYKVCPHRNVAAAYRRFYGHTAAVAFARALLKRLIRTS